ncbi:hypothetical protein FC83_GL000756 [Agrilactobacillus composti DSM 18527 = JCM 14202]|uniref:Surface layer protein A domain-containing protein n=1 Tax=Agrilactobacillus composti DSM 18527 = JCM 14202 TaxID=1423734 RepID=X0PRF8_9LACO|nr:3D domain-containing protein [Agrilactobacillus composti]KRM31460.1 hypothetical protein FC83_GL000756 [Agrilactobacillus composti DSM 18527 = JCM 14202]GAF40417.1 TolA protein [Agrilactobacillus composti DSM 18527 = JCM 14202]
MKLRYLLLTAMTLGTVTTGALATTATSTPNTVSAATTGDTPLDKTMYATAATTVNAAPNWLPSAQVLAAGTAWHISASRVVNNQVWYEVGGNQWVNGATMSDNPTASPIDATLYVASQYGAAVYNSPYTGNVKTGQVLDKNSGWKVTAQVNVGGDTWYQVGGDQWVWGPDMTFDQPVTQAPGVVMNATAYDPRVLGNYTFGYDTVAANLNVYPRGTKLRITFGDGSIKDYVVRDTGTFAYANPNQLDIAMPNWQAMQFGRQNVTVSVLS